MNGRKFWSGRAGAKGIVPSRELSTSFAAGYLRLAETVTGFLARLRETAKTLDVAERQRIVRLLVKEILVDDDTIVIRHSISSSNRIN